MATDVSSLAILDEFAPDYSLLGRKAYVTGGSRGIGRAVALALASAGADVAIGCNTGGDAAEEVCHILRAAGRKAEVFPHDISRPEDVADSCARILDTFEGIDILVHNAGITRDRSFKKMTLDDWNTVLETNLHSAFHVTKPFIEDMAERGWGRVINVSSIVGEIGNFGQANYAAAKAGLIGLTKTLAREYARKGVTVNAVAPGFIKTRMTEGIPDRAIESVLSMTPIGRMGDPGEIAGAILYLASPNAGFITGHVLDVNGGLAM